MGTLASVVIAPAVLVMVFLAGHSGAEATWANVLAATSQGASAETSDAEGYTLDEVAAHATIDDCWIVVDGTVYDASGYAAAHPGGASRIADICGTDATQAFRNQHGNQGSPNRTLAGFELGPLKN